MTFEKCRDQAIKDLHEQITYLKREMKAAKAAGDNKAYLSMLRLYLPAQKSFLNLCHDQESGEQADELLEFQNSFRISER